MFCLSCLFSFIHLLMREGHPQYSFSSVLFFFFLPFCPLSNFCFPGTFNFIRLPRPLSPPSPEVLFLCRCDGRHTEELETRIYTRQEFLIIKLRPLCLSCLLRFICWRDRGHRQSDEQCGGGTVSKVLGKLLRDRSGA